MVLDLNENGFGRGHIGKGGFPLRNRGAGSWRYLGSRISGSVNFGAVKISKKKAVRACKDDE